MAWDEVQPKTKSRQLRRKPFVCIAIPHWGKVALEWVIKTFGPLNWKPHPAFDKKIELARGILNIDTERNELVKQALKNPSCTHILFLDTDVTVENPPDPNIALEMLLATNSPVASGLYRRRHDYIHTSEHKQKVGFNYAMWLEHGDQYVPVQQWSEGANWIRVDAIGMGFCLFKREIFEKIPPPWFKWHEIRPSEDFFFCKLLKQHDYEIRVLTDIELSHIGTLKVKPDGSITSLEV